MAFKISEKQVYRFERFIAKGGSSIFISLLFLFLAAFATMVVLRVLAVWAEPGEDAAFTVQSWRVFLEMTDPGNMSDGNNSGAIVRVITVTASMIGVIIFSMLIAFISTSLENVLYEFRKGRGKVLEKNHTLILGWNERVVDILLELIIANESEKTASVVILSQMSKEEMDDEIIKRLPDTKTTRIITSSGNPALLSELSRMNVEYAKSIIVLTNCSDNAPAHDKELSDINSMKVVVAFLACKTGRTDIPVITEMFSEEKRTLLEFFRAPNIVSINAWRVMGKLLFQTSLSSGLAIVYNEILSFAGNELYFYKGHWNAGSKFGDMAYHFVDGVPVGFFRPGTGISVMPAFDTVILPDDELILLATDNSAVAYLPEAPFKPAALKLSTRALAKMPRRILILGWHEIGRIFATESQAYLLEGSVIDVIAFDPSGQVAAQTSELDKSPKVRVSYNNVSPMSYDVLLNANPYSYDNIVILSQDMNEESSEKIDSHTLMMLFMLRRVSEETKADKSKTIVMTQVLNSQNQELIEQTDVDDFIVSNKFITMFLAQLSEQPRIKDLYDIVFKEDGSEIYVKPAWLYFEDFSQDIAFADMIGTAARRKEICLGFRIGKNASDKTKHFGIQLNPPKDNLYRLTPQDFLVVLSENEL